MIRSTVIVYLLLATFGRAHQIAEMTMQVAPLGTGFKAIIEVDAAYMLPEYRGDIDVAAQDLAWLRGLDPSEWERIRRETADYLRECLVFRGDSDEVEWRISFPDFDQVPPTFAIEGIPEMPPMLTVQVVGEFTDRLLNVSWDEPFGVVLIVQAGNETIPIVSGYHEPVLKRESDSVVKVVLPSPARWIFLGFRHIIPEGLDHVLFILGIFLLLPKWKPLLAQSLVFTLSHSVTLGLAAVGWVSLPEFWVELAIAASIAWIGLENLWIKDAGKGRYLLIGVFGLIHGLGFARMLTPLLPIDRPDALLAGITGFNVGVELGQLLVLAMAFLVFGWWPEEHFKKVRIAGSLLVAAAGLFMFLERAIGG